MIKEELEIILRYVFVFIICIALVLPFVQYLFFTADNLIAAEQLDKLSLNYLKWLLLTFEILKLLIILELILFIKYKKSGNLLILFIGVCMFLVWMQYTLTDKIPYIDDVIAFIEGYIYVNGIITSLCAVGVQVILFVIYRRKRLYKV